MPGRSTTAVSPAVVSGNEAQHHLLFMGKDFATWYRRFTIYLADLKLDSVLIDTHADVSSADKKNEVFIKLSKLLADTEAFNFAYENAYNDGPKALKLLKKRYGYSYGVYSLCLFKHTAQGHHLPSSGDL